MKRREFTGPILALTLLLGIAQSSIGESFNSLQALPSAAVTIDRNDADGIRLVMQIPPMGMMQAVANGDPTDRPALAEEPSTLTPGYPQLPMVVRNVLIPPACGVRLVVHNLRSRTEANFTPFIAPDQNGLSDLDVSGQPSEAFLNAQGFWPPEPIKVCDPVVLRGNRIVQVIYFPMQYNPSTHEVRYNDDVDFELVYDGDPINPVSDPTRSRPSQHFDAIVSSLVINPPQTKVSRDDIPGRGSYMIVYYNTQAVSNAIAPLITWRKRQGWNVIAAGFNANTSSNDIKRRIQQEYNGSNPPEMIALVGDPDWGSNGVPAWSQTTDKGYAQLDGNDELADADYGRISAASDQELSRVIAKIVNYESDPYMQDVAWYHNGAVCAGESTSGISTVFVSRWVRRLALDRTWTNVAEWYFVNGQGSVPQFFRDQFGRGISFLTYRGYIGMSQVTANEIMNYQATRRNPFATTLTCASGEYVGQFGNTEALFRSAGGAIGSIGFCTAQTHVPYNNTVFTGIWQGIFKYDLFNIGSACNYGRYELWRQYSGFENDMVSNFSSWANLMGDPATEMWTDEPLRIDASYEATLALGASRVTVAVTKTADGDPIENANVCLFKANDDFQMVSKTNAEGVAEFAIPTDALTAGQDLLVTVTKHNVKPHLGQITVGQAEQYLGVESWEISQDNDDDGIANPGESFALNMQLKNFGNQVPEGDLVIVGRSLTPLATIANDTLELGQSPEANAASEITMNVRLDPTTPNGTLIPIAIYTTSDQAMWRSMVQFKVEAPKIEITQVHIPNNRFNPGTVIDFDLTIHNSGLKRLDAATATLWSETSSVTVIQDEATYNALNEDGAARITGQLFRLRSDSITIPGSSAILKLAIETGAGFRDTTTTTIVIGQGAVTDPFGPDKYGYVCFDSGDEGWEMKPTYDWVEIDPEVEQHEFAGTLLNLRDQSEDDDHSALVDLPFTFQYYGKEFNQITVNTNGWAAFGNWIELADFRNRRIATGEGPEAQLSVFWDDMITGRILTHHDAENGQFIVEWNGMRSASSGETQTFELILQDIRFHPTYSYDGVILYQYKEVNNPNGPGPANDTPYSTIGIGNLNDTDGLEYTYYNSYNRSAKRLEDRMAIKFTTAIEYITGVLTGYVTDFATGAPVPGALISTPRGFNGRTDENGRYFIDEILIGDYASITVRCQGFNDSTWYGNEGQGFTIHEAETLMVDHSLLHPEFNLNEDQFEFMMLNDSATTSGFQISNDGNGTLWFNSKFAVVLEGEEGVNSGNLAGKVTVTRDDADDRWGQLLGFDVSHQLDNPRMQSITYVRDHWLVAGGHIGEVGDNYFYEFDKNGVYTGVRFLQPVPGLYGIRDMEYFNGYIYGTYTDSSRILQMDATTGEEIMHWRTPRGVNNMRNLTIDPATQHLWLSGVSTRLFEFEIVDTQLVSVNTFAPADPRTGDALHMYGLAWFRDDPDGFKLYVMSNDEVENDAAHANIALFKVNPLNGETRYLTDLPFMDSTASGRCGISITSKWNSGVYALAAMFDVPEPIGDIVKVLELAPNSSWIDYSPRTDTLIAGEQRPVEIMIESSDLDTGRYQLYIEYNHNAGNGVTRIPVELNVVTELPNDLNDQTELPLEYSLSPVWPNPFNARTSIAYSLKNSGKVRLEVYDVSGRLVATLIDGEQKAGRYQITFNGDAMAAGLYIYRLNSGGFNSSQKMLLLK